MEESGGMHSEFAQDMEDDYPEIEQKQSGEPLDELEFTMDHFGPETTLQGSNVSDSDVPFNDSPQMTSTANRDDSRGEEKFVARQSRVNRGVPRTRLDL